MTQCHDGTVLLVAFTCEPDLGSEYEVGWRWSIGAGKVFRSVIVFTRLASLRRIPGERDTYRRWPARRLGNILFVGIDLPFADRLSGRTLMRTHYAVWQLLLFAFLKVSKLPAAIIHHVAFVAVWMSPVAAFVGRPFIWGPIGTNKPVPHWYGRVRLSSWVRYLVKHWWPKVSPLGRRAQKNALRLLPINSHVHSLLSPVGKAKSLTAPAIRIPQALVLERYVSLLSRKRRILFVGRAIDVKLPLLANDVGRSILDADPSVEFWMIGEGLSRIIPRPYPERMRVLNFLPQSQVWEIMSGSMVMLFPSVEGSGFVVLEAMALGLPIVCLEDTGPAAFIGFSGGIPCPSGPSYEHVHHQLKEAVLRLLSDKALWEKLSTGARNRASEFTWEDFPKFLYNLYDEVIFETS